MVQLRTGASFRDGILLISFPGLGLVGNISLRYYVERGGFKWTGYLFSRRLPPIGRVKKGRIYYPINVFSRSNVHAILSDVPIPEDLSWEVAHTIMEKAWKDGAKLVVVLSGVLSPSSEDVYVIASNESARKFAGHLRPIENGVVTGVTASLLLLGRERNVPVLLLLGPTSGRKDISAAPRLVSEVGRITGIEVDVDDLVLSPPEEDHLDVSMYG